MYYILTQDDLDSDNKLETSDLISNLCHISDDEFKKIDVANLSDQINNGELDNFLNIFDENHNEQESTIIDA